MRLREREANIMVQDNVIMPIRGEGLVDGDDEEQQQDEHQQVSYVLHPNCGIFDDE